MSVSRKDIVLLANSWIGKKESDGSYKEIIDIYNLCKQAKTKMEYGWAWCACTASALHIKLGSEDIFPIEISCGRMIEKAIDMKCWVEDDTYVALPGDNVVYDWDDDAKNYATTDNKGWPEHVGVIVKVDKVRKKFLVVEGNYGHAVKTRELDFNGRFIRGFITPKYKDNTVPDGSIIEEVQPVKKEDMSKIQNEASAKTNSPTAKIQNADLKDASLSGKYKTTGSLFLRSGAGTKYPDLVVMPINTTVQSWGYYTLVSGTKWLYVEATVKGVKYVGHCSSKYLKKVK